MKAICVRCAEPRGDYAAACPRCGHRPEGEGLLISWLLSTENLSKSELEAAAERVRQGSVIRPSDRMLDRARKALGKDFSSDPGLTAFQRLALLSTSLLITPLPGWVCWLWWRRERPRAALQALALSAPASAAGFVLMLWLLFN